jgi:translation initiation factor 1
VGQKLSDLSQLASLLTQEEKSAIDTAEKQEKKKAPGKGQEARVFTDSKRRRGKTVTIVAGIRWPRERLEELARELKQHCASGGTVADGEIEIQGDHRQKISAKLLAQGFTLAR